MHDLYEYDEHGNVTERTDRRGKVVTFTYDALDQLTSRTVDGQSTTFGTDPAGRFTWAENAASLDSLLFDAAGRPEGQVTVRGQTVYRLLESYNERDLRDSVWMTAPWSESIKYQWNAFDQLEALTDLAGGTSTVTYNKDRQPIGRSFPPDIQRSLEYPSTHVPGEITWNDATLNAQWGSAYVQDALGRIEVRTPLGSFVTREFEYNEAGWLTGYMDIALQNPDCVWDGDRGSECFGFPTDTVASKSYAYDAVGNPADSAAVVDTGNRLTEFDGYALSWDDGGFLVSKLEDGFAQYFYWNGLGQLDSVTTNGAVTSFGYDGFGRRIGKLSGGDTLQYVYDGDHFFMELDGAGNRIAEYTFWPGIDDPHSVRRNGAVFYFGDDGFGSVRGMFDATGGLERTYGYGVWGGTGVPSSDPNRLRFAGRVWDSETGLYHNRARYYDPSIRRFISEDPIGLLGGINPYAYAANDPLNARDPSGLCSRVTQEDGRQVWIGCGDIHVGVPGWQGQYLRFHFTPSLRGAWRSTAPLGGAGSSGMFGWGLAWGPAGEPETGTSRFAECSTEIGDAALALITDVMFLTGVGILAKGVVLARGASGVAAQLGRSEVTRHLATSTVEQGRAVLQAHALTAGSWIGVWGGSTVESLHLRSSSQRRFFDTLADATPVWGSYRALGRLQQCW